MSGSFYTDYKSNAEDSVVRLFTDGSGKFVEESIYLTDNINSSEHQNFSRYISSEDSNYNSDDPKTHLLIPPDNKINKENIYTINNSVIHEEISEIPLDNNQRSEDSTIHLFVIPDERIIEESIYLGTTPKNNRRSNPSTDTPSNNISAAICNNSPKAFFKDNTVQTSLIFKEDIPINLLQRNIHHEMDIRINLAQQHKLDKGLLRPINTDKLFTNLFSKGLEHDSDGFVNRRSMKTLILAVQNHDLHKLSQVKLAGNLKLLCPSAAWIANIFGPSSSTYRYSLPPDLSSNIISYDMCELYCMALTRDIPFRDYSTNPLVIKYCQYLNLLNNYLNYKVTPYNIFRNPLQQGSYISQFLYKRKFDVSLPIDYMKTWETAMLAQNGIISEFSETSTISKYITTGRDLAKVIIDPLQIFLETHDTLVNMNVPINKGIFKTNVEEFSFDIKYLLTLISRNALLASSYVKWNTMFLRPEALGINIERIFRTGNNVSSISHELLSSNILEETRYTNGNALLSQVFPEGCPCSPAACSAFATIAGCCATILKFFFDLEREVNINEPLENGELVITQKNSTLEQEINKLTFNVADSRKWSGISYNRDIISGLKRGEKVAISCIKDVMSPYNYRIKLRRFNGVIIEIFNQR